VAAAIHLIGSELRTTTASLRLLPHDGLPSDSVLTVSASLPRGDFFISHRRGLRSEVVQLELKTFNFTAIVESQELRPKSQTSARGRPANQTPSRFDPRIILAVLA
jgi:hypothetical protein